MKWEDFSIIPLSACLALVAWFSIAFFLLVDLFFLQLLSWHIDLGVIVAMTITTYLIINEG